MKPIRFPQQTVELQKPSGMTDEECGPLPVFRDGKHCISCWSPSWRERLALALGRPLWLWVWMGNTQPPVSLDVVSPFIEREVSWRERVVLKFPSIFPRTFRRWLSFGLLVFIPIPSWAQAPTVTVSGDGAATVVSVGTQGPPGASASTAGIIADVKLYGALGNGTTDDSAAVIAAVAAVNTAGGGVVYFPVGTYRIDSQLAIPQTGDIQKAIRLTGAAGWFGGNSPTASGASQLDLRYAGGYKIYTTGTGLLEIDHLTLKDTTDGTRDFIFSSFTTLMVHDVAFFGKTADAPTQDAIVLGDRTTGTPPVQYKFQGYGTIITANFFENIRRAVYLQKFANGLVITNNTVWLHCGADAAAAAFEADGVDSSVDGLTLTGNLVEMPNYVYGVKLTYTARRGTYNNNFFDADATGTSYYYLSADSIDNTIIAGEGQSLPLVSGPGATLSNIFDTSAAYHVRLHNHLEMVNGQSIIVPNPGGLFFTTGLTSGIYRDGSDNLIFKSGSVTPVSIHPTYFSVDDGNLSYLGGPVTLNGSGVAAKRIQMGGLDGTGTTFANLPASVNGTILFCSDCTAQSNPCTGTGTGAFAHKLNGAWDCR